MTFGGLRCADAPHLRGVGFTSGTTGDPTPLPRSEHHVTLDGAQRELWRAPIGQLHRNAKSLLGRSENFACFVNSSSLRIQCELYT